MERIIMENVTAKELVSLFISELERRQGVEEQLKQPFYTIPQAAEILQMQQATVRIHLASGKIRGKRVSERKTLISREELSRILKG